LLAWGGNAWHVVEFAIAVAAGVAASSVALVAFGVDSLIELLAGGVIVWLFTGKRVGLAAAERRAQQIIAVSFFALCAAGRPWGQCSARVVTVVTAANDGHRFLVCKVRVPAPVSRA
jgi:hypothetical protein